MASFDPNFVLPRCGGNIGFPHPPHLAFWAGSQLWNAVQCSGSQGTALQAEQSPRYKPSNSECRGESSSIRWRRRSAVHAISCAKWSQLAGRPRGRSREWQLLWRTVSSVSVQYSSQRVRFGLQCGAVLWAQKVCTINSEKFGQILRSGYKCMERYYNCLNIKRRSAQYLA